MKFKIGDRVIGVKDDGDVILIGEKGTVKKVYLEDEDVSFEFDKPVKDEDGDIVGHDCDDIAKDGHGRYVREKHIELL